MIPSEAVLTFFGPGRRSPSHDRIALTIARASRRSWAWAVSVLVLAAVLALTTMAPSSSAMTTAVGLGVQISAGQHPVRGGPPAMLAQRRSFHTYRAGPIETVVVGDEVRASDLETRAGGNRPVTAVHRDLGTGFADLLVREADGDLALSRATTHHEIWDSAVQDWAHAIELRVGDALLAANGRTITVAAPTTYTGQRLMYDPSVQRVHTYYVLSTAADGVATGSAVLVHNAGGACDLGGARQVRGRFPNEADPGETLVRNSPTTGAPTLLPGVRRERAPGEAGRSDGQGPRRDPNTACPGVRPQRESGDGSELREPWPGSGCAT